VAEGDGGVAEAASDLSGAAEDEKGCHSVTIRRREATSALSR
jgi:hypothetical protein